jgi:hypothetical protein
MKIGILVVVLALIAIGNAKLFIYGPPALKNNFTNGK